MRPLIPLTAGLFLLLLVATPAHAVAACSDVTASDGTVLSLTALDNAHGVHVWYHGDEVEGWIELNGLAGLQYLPCADGGGLYDADGRFL